jgi:hypothetical protein
MTAITYIGKNSGIVVALNKKQYEFEWQKSLGIGRANDEVDLKHAKSLSRWKDKSGRKMFRIE